MPFSVVNTKLFSSVMAARRACAVGTGKEYCFNVNSLLILERSVVKLTTAARETKVIGALTKGLKCQLRYLLTVVN